MRKVISWDQMFFDICYAAAQRSKDPTTNVGACLMRENRVLAVGYNGFPMGFAESPELWERPTKYTYVVHAEMNCILTAARYGIALEGASIYTTLFPCSNCAKHMLQAGIKEIVYDATQEPRDLQDAECAKMILKDTLTLRGYQYSQPKSVSS